MRPFATFALPFLVFFSSEQLSTEEADPVQQRQFLLDPFKIDLLFRRTALMALLRAKARATLKQVPTVERVLFGHCLTDTQARSPIAFAKCLVSLIRARDRENGKNKANEEQKIADENRAAAEQKLNPVSTHRMRHFFALWRRREGSRRRVGDRQRMRRVRIQRRQKRNDVPSSIRNLHTLERYALVLDKCRQFVARKTAQNARLVSRLLSNARVYSSSAAEGPSDLRAMQHQIEQFFSQLDSKRHISLLSPRLFALFPSHRRRHLLSPSVLSFHNQSALSIPQLLQTASLGEREAVAWLDLLLNATGTEKVLHSLIERLRPHVERMEQEVLPAIRRIETKEREWRVLRSSLDAAQLRRAEHLGYTQLRGWQKQMVLGPGGAGEEEDWEQAERRLEATISELAAIDDQEWLQQGQRWNKSAFLQRGNIEDGNSLGKRRRYKRQEVGGLAPDTESGLRPIPNILTLEPFSFDTRLGGVVLEGLFLSPHAFYRELTSPEVLTIHVLSPVAFYATILSPMALIARILSPEAFKAQVLTPQVLTTYVLSPEALIAEVLSPIAAESRILSPRTLFVQILGPTLGAVHVGSPDTHGVLVLSPHVLSPRIYSEEKYLIEVLSPHFLGGEHSPEEEEDEHEHFGGAVKFVGWPGHSPLGESESDERGHTEGAHEREGNAQSSEHVHEETAGPREGQPQPAAEPKGDTSNINAGTAETGEVHAEHASAASESSPKGALNAIGSQATKTVAAVAEAIGLGKPDKKHL